MALPASPTSRSTLPLSEVARHVHFPDGIVSTGWPAVERRCSEMGLRFDRWQDGIGRLALGKDVEGKYSATVGGITLSIPRQVGKTFLVGAIIFALCTLTPGLTVLWTAHRTRTSTQTFRSLSGMAKRKRIAKFIQAVRSTNGEQEIRFTNGSVIMFGAREQGFGRGFDSVDVEVFDEAQILTEKALEDMVPAANASKQPTGALLFFMGTPPRPIDPGEEFANRRTKALAGELRGVYVEFSADADASPDDLEQIAKANPSFPDRTPLESIQRMREQLTDEESFMREAMGIWSVKAAAHHAIPPDAWAKQARPSSVAEARLSLGIDIAPDQSMASIALAVQRADGSWHIELDQQAPGTGWVVDYLAQLLAANPSVQAVVVDGASAASALIASMEKEGISPRVTTARDMSRACQQILAAITNGELWHIDQPQMNAALTGAAKRMLRDGDGWVWSRKASTSDITPMISATLALWGAQQDIKAYEHPLKKSGRTSTKRRGFVG